MSEHSDQPITQQTELFQKEFEHVGWYNKITVTFPERMIVKTGFASVDNNFPQGDIFDYYLLRNAIFIYCHEQYSI